MNTPRVLRQQLKLYEAHGFHVIDVEHRAGSHFRVRFAEFEQPQFLTANVGCPHAIRNNLARFRALSKEKVT